MTLAERPRTKAGGVVHEIAARRRTDVQATLDALGRDGLRRALAAAPGPRDVVGRLAAPGLHLIAEVKRRSPSAGDIAASDDAVARARAYAAGGASVISVLCEPHWFGGSIDDLRAVRAAVAVPVLAKDFIVDPRQLDLLRAAGADLVLLLAVLHPPARLARLAVQARDLGLEPLVEAHDAREIEAALGTDARLIGINNRDLRTLEVDPEQAVRLRELIPGDRLAIAESGVRDPSTVARWRATGFDAALVGEALMRSADPSAAARTFVAAGRDPRDISADARAPFVKICGVTDEAGILAAVRAGADAIGLNFAPGTPRELSIDEGTALARLARASATASAAGPRIVVVTADLRPDALRDIVAAVDPDADPAEWRRAGVGHRAGRAARLEGAQGPSGRRSRGADHGRPRVARGRRGADPARHGRRPVPGRDRRARRGGDRSRGRAPGPGDAGRRPASRERRRCAARDPGDRGGRRLGHRCAAGQRGASPQGSVPRRAVRQARPGRPPPSTQCRLWPRARAPRPARGRRRRSMGDGARLRRPLRARDARRGARQLEAAYDAVRHDPRFWAELDHLLGRFAGRPTALYRADRLAEAAAEEARRLAEGAANGRRRPPSIAIPAFRLYLKREDLAHTGAHKINNALGQALLTRRLGKTRVIAETGAGQHGVATATACALLGLPCVVFMGEEDIRRQAPNVLRMHALGAEVRSVTSGTATLKDAINEAMRDWVTNVESTHYVLGSAMGPHPYPTIVRDLQRRIGDEAAAQFPAVEGRLPDLALACVGGGSNAIGLLSRFIGEPSVRLAVAEAAGDGVETGRHAAAIAGGTPGILHGSRSLMLQDRDGQIVEAHSASAGLDYPGVGPQLAALAEAGGWRWRRRPTVRPWRRCAP